MNLHGPVCPPCSLVLQTASSLRGVQVLVVHSADNTRHDAYVNDGNSLRRYRFAADQMVHVIDLGEGNVSLIQVDLATGKDLD